MAANYGTTKSVGFDINKSDNWATSADPNVVLTTDPNVVASNGPYDIVVIFDTIDHLQGIQPTDLLKITKSMLTPNGKIYMRAHPFTSRHGTHHYHDLNKAFVHLIFTPAELNQLIPNSTQSQFNLGVMTPIATYQKMFDDAGLKIANRRDIKEQPETFFKTPIIANRIMQITGHKSYPEFQMSLSFIDYTLTN